MIIQASKAKLFKDEQTLKKIMSSKSPGEMKALGTKVHNFNQDIWVKSAMQIAIQCHNAKFAQNPCLSNFLLATGNNTIIKASPRDNLWGIGLSRYDPMIMTKQFQWGKNIQGKSLMNVLNSIREASSNQTTSHSF